MKVILTHPYRTSVSGRVLAAGTTGNVIEQHNGHLLIDFGLKNSVVSIPVESRAVEVVEDKAAVAA